MYPCALLTLTDSRPGKRLLTLLNGLVATSPPPSAVLRLPGPALSAAIVFRDDSRTFLFPYWAKQGRLTTYQFCRNDDSRASL